MEGSESTTATVWRIRKARAADWSAILHLQSSQNRPMRRDSKASEYFVVFVDKELVGSAAVRCNCGIGYLYGLVVAKPWRRKGIGHALTDACLGHLRRTGVKGVLALAMFWNIRFFRKHGFSVVRRNSFPSLNAVHGDFSEEWCRRSTLLYVGF